MFARLLGWLLLWGWILLGVGYSVQAQNIHPNFLPPGAPLPGESQSVNRTYYPTSRSNSSSAQDPYIPGGGHGLQTGSPNHVSEASQSSQYAPQTSDSLPGQQISRYPTAAMPDNLTTTTPSNQVRQQDDPQAYLRQAMRHTAGQQTSTPAMNPSSGDSDLAPQRKADAASLRMHLGASPATQQVQMQTESAEASVGQASQQFVAPRNYNTPNMASETPQLPNRSVNASIHQVSPRYQGEPANSAPAPETITPPHSHAEFNNPHRQDHRSADRYGVLNASPERMDETQRRPAAADNRVRNELNHSTSLDAAQRYSAGAYSNQRTATGSEVSDSISQGNQADQTAAATTVETPELEVTQQEAAVENSSAQAELGTLIQQRIKELEAATSLEEQVKQDALSVLKSAAEWLTRASQWERKVAEYRNEMAGVPAAIAQAKVQLEQPIAIKQPEITTEMGLVQLEQMLTEEENVLKQHQQALAEHEKQLKLRTERKGAIGKQLEQLEARLLELQKSLQSVVVEGLSPELAQAKQLELKVRELASMTERQLLQTEVLRHEAVTELLPLQLDLAKRNVKQQEAFVAAWREAVADFRKQESERQAREARERVANAHPALKALAERNANLAERRTELAERIEAIHGELEWINATQKEIDLQFKSITEKVKVVGLSSTVGMLLRKQRGELPNLAFHYERLEEIERDLPQVQLASLELEEERETIGDVDAAVGQVVAQLKTAAGHFQPQELRGIVKEFLETKKKYLDDLHNDNDAYQDALGELDIATRKLTGKTAEFCEYIDKHVLWIRSAEPISTTDFTQSWSALKAAGGLATMGTIFQGFQRSWQQHPAQWLSMIIGFILLRLAASRIRHRLARLHLAKESGPLAVIGPMLASLGLTLFNAMMWPTLAWLVGWQLGVVAGKDELLIALATGLMTIAVLGIALEITRQACMPGGLAETYLAWKAEQLQPLRQKLRWLMLLGLPAVFAVVLLDGWNDGEWADSAGRLVFIAGMALLGLLSHSLLHPSARLWRKADEGSGMNLIQKLRFVWYAISLAAPLGLAWLAATGYYYSARELAVRMKMSFWLLVTTVLVTSLLTRLLLVVAQGISRHKRFARESVAPAESEPFTVQPVAMAEAGEATESPSPIGPAIVQTIETSRTHELEEEANHSATMRSQVVRMVQGAALILFCIISYHIWAEVLPAFRVLDKVELWSSVREVMEEVTDPEGNVTLSVVKKAVPTTLTHLILALAIFQITLLAAKNLPGLLEIAVLNRLPIDRGGRYAVSVVCRYALTVTGFIFGFRMLGLTWSSVQWLIAAMTVGLGFGLQEIFANFVSGMIILFERPVRVGDLVTISGMTGHVTRVQIRATTITDPDRRELIVPNKNFITGELINWTLSDSITRVVIPLGVAYGSDVSLTQSTLLGVGMSHPLILNEPEPAAIFVSFGDSTLNFELRFFLGSRERYGQVLHEVNTAIEKAFREANIEIAFPQQEVTIKSLGPLVPHLKESVLAELENKPALHKAA